MNAAERNAQRILRKPRTERSNLERLELRRQADNLAIARANGESDGRALASDPGLALAVPSFETMIELDTYFGGCYAGYKAELRAFDLTFEDFKPILEARASMAL